MYWRHFNLTAEPFSLTPDPSFLYLSPVHAEAYAALMMGLRERRGLTTMIGEVGTGKTTLVYSVLSGLGPEINTAYVSNARLSFDGILRVALRDFGVQCDSTHSTELTDTLNAFLLDCANKGTTAAMVIDEAQNLSPETFEDLRLLTNFETYTHKLLQIVLVGQPELDTKLRDPSLRQVAERIAVRCVVNPLSRRESRAYLEHRLAAVNGSLDIFTRPAVQMLIARSRGIPRSLNILAHNAMLFAYGEATDRVSRRFVASAVREKEGRGLVRLWKRSPRTGTAARTEPKRGFRSSMWTLSAAALGGVVVGLAVAGGENLLGRMSTPPATATAPEPVSQPHVAAVSPPQEQPAQAQPATEASAVEAPAAEGAASDAAPALAALPEPAAVAAVVETAPDVAPFAPAVVIEPVAAPVVPPAAVEPVVTVEPEIPASAEAAPSASVESAPAAAGEPELPQQPAAALPIGEPQPAPVIAAPVEEAAPPPIVAPPAVPEPTPQARPAAVAAATRPATTRPDPAPRAPAAASPAARTPAPRTAPPAAATASAPRPAAAARPVDARPQAPAAAQGAARVITVPPGSSLSGLLLTVYGQYSSEMIDRVRAENPQVNDPDVIIAGDKLRFPDAAPGQPEQAAGNQENR